MIIGLSGICSVCSLELPIASLVKCDGHCDKVLCIPHLKKHALEVSHIHRQIPAMVRGPKKWKH